MSGIPVFMINLGRRPDRLERMTEHLAERGIDWRRTEAVDAAAAPMELVDRVAAESGPLGALRLGDRACTCSHRAAWGDFIGTGARFGMILEDDAYLSADASEILADDGWLPEGVDVVKLEKFGYGGSRVLTGASVATLSNGRELRPLLSRHVGSAAYIVSRRAAEAAFAAPAPFTVPLDHLLFNPNVSAFARRFPPAIVLPTMATQRAWGYDSDIAALGKAARPDGWAKRWRSVRRGWFEVNRLPRQLWWLARGARVREVRFEE